MEGDEIVTGVTEKTLRALHVDRDATRRLDRLADRLAERIHAGTLSLDDANALIQEHWDEDKSVGTNVVGLFGLVEGM